MFFTLFSLFLFHFLFAFTWFLLLLSFLPLVFCICLYVSFYLLVCFSCLFLYFWLLFTSGNFLFWLFEGLFCFAFFLFVCVCFIPFYGNNRGVSCLLNRSLLRCFLIAFSVFFVLLYMNILVFFLLHSCFVCIFHHFN